MDMSIILVHIWKLKAALLHRQNKIFQETHNVTLVSVFHYFLACNNLLGVSLA